VSTDRVDIIPDGVFKKYYGCASLVRLPFVHGIGHVDERIKFLSKRLALTDVPEYEDILRVRGYEVRLLPRGEEQYETYVNSLLINGTVFLPIFEFEKDKEAIEIYKKYGFKVVPIVVDELPNVGMGAIHCMTMTYPEMPKEVL
jgi:agmatine/peptidylarginine deiminase